MRYTFSVPTLFIPYLSSENVKIVRNIVQKRIKLLALASAFEPALEVCWRQCVTCHERERERERERAIGGRKDLRFTCTRRIENP